MSMIDMSLIGFIILVVIGSAIGVYKALHEDD